MVLYEIKERSNSFGSRKLHYEQRTTNGEAHRLDRMASSMDARRYIWLDSPLANLCIPELAQKQFLQKPVRFWIFFLSVLLSFISDCLCLLFLFVFSYIYEYIFNCELFFVFKNFLKFMNTADIL